MSYTELQVTSNFTFLTGASHPNELVEKAAQLGYSKIAITDRNTLAGIVRAHAATKNVGIKLIPGARLDLLDGPSLLAYPTDKDAYGRLSALLTEGNLRAEKGKCFLYKADVFKYAKGIKFIAIAPPALNKRFQYDNSFYKVLAEYRQAFGNQVYLAANKTYQGDDNKKLFQLSALGSQLDIPLIATNDVYYHEPSRRQLQDIVTCIREKCTIYTAGYKLLPNAERHLKPIQEMKRLFRQYPEAIRRTQEIAEACQFSLSELQYVYPEEITTPGRSPQEDLTILTWQGAHEHFGDNIPQKTADTIRFELAFIEQMNYACYFLTVYDIVRYARQQGILCQGRGSAANSTVCFCLGITSVNPTKFDLLFERFISSARNEPPDIDIDFEHSRREEVIQYIYRKYGRDRAAIVATVTTQHQKGAIRDVGKAMGLSEDTITKLSGTIWGHANEWFDEKRLLEQGFNPRDPHLLKVLELTGQFITFPRQLGQHTGGFVITQGKLTDLCPIINARMEDRTNIEWNKDDIDILKFLKIDVLALGMLTCIRKAFDLVEKHYGISLTLANVPQDDKAVYEMVGRADTIGVFQIESRAQQAMLPKMKPTCFYDLVIEVALVRPGPIVGNMVHPYLRRRNGQEPVTYPSKELEEILGRTLGIPLFQEQAMRIAIHCAGYSPDEADQLRRDMATFKLTGKVSSHKKKLIEGMIARGFTEEYAGRIFEQLEGFGSYGFPESHAASFALLVYVSAWLKCYYPDVFAAALLNSLPMGFYQPPQIVADAQRHDVQVLPVDVNLSDWDNTLEDSPGKYRVLRLGFRQIKGMREDVAKLLVSRREAGYTTVSQLQGVGLSLSAVEQLADADAFRSIGLDRRQALWQASALADRPHAMFEGQSAESEIESTVTLPQMSLSEHVIHDYASITLSLKAHPLSFLREKLRQLNIISATELKHMQHGTDLQIAGLVLVRQRPGTAKGVCFITIEDETAVANLVVFGNLFDAFRKQILQARLLMVKGTLQKEGDVIHVIVKQCHDLTKMLSHLDSANKEEGLPDKAQETDGKIPTMQPRAQQQEIFPKGRNFK